MYSIIIKFHPRFCKLHHLLKVLLQTHKRYWDLNHRLVLLSISAFNLKGSRGAFLQTFHIKSGHVETSQWKGSQHYKPGIYEFMFKKNYKVIIKL